MVFRFYGFVLFWVWLCFVLFLFFFFGGGVFFVVYCFVFLTALLDVSAWLFGHLLFWVSYKHVFCICTVQRTWVCFTWKGALEIRSLLSAYLSIYLSIYLSRARNSHPSDCPGQVDFRSDNRKRSHHLPFGQVDFEYSYWWKGASRKQWFPSAVQ